MTSLNQKIELQNSQVSLFIKREDLLHPYISGNKLRKLKYNITEVKKLGFSKIVTFGGAFSNHIAATSYAGFLNNIETVGIIRGEELKFSWQENPTLKFASEHGMQFKFVTREEYREKESVNLVQILKKEFGSFYLLPEGGTNELAIKGCEEILNSEDATFDYITVSVGTGGTIAGIINKSSSNQKILGFPALKGDFLKKDICKFAKKNNWDLISDYHFGGYAKTSSKQILFINEFFEKYKIPLDPIYTSKMVFGVLDKIEKGYFPVGSKILMIHTGGLQGIKGMNEKLNAKNEELIEVKY
ncbi:MAG: 1-aminocyclopropane-1-carboxylate deaminase [Flavobacterium sp.]